MEYLEPERLYDERGDTARSRMIFQGDVFEGIVLPGFGDEPRHVQVVSHPCAMRSGVPLNERTTVAPIEILDRRLKPQEWDRRLRVMPLEELTEDTHHVAKFVDITAAPSVLLTLDRRIATLSDAGIYVLQQRLIKHYTRFEVDLPSLATESAGIVWELHQQRDWIETVLDETDWTVDKIEAEEIAFDQWMNEGQPSRREQLKSDYTHTDLRKQAHTAALARRAEVAG